MPLYEYECQSCGRRTETLQRLGEAPLTVCPECGGPLKKLISAPGIHFKGSGWYVTDYAGKQAGGKSKTEAGEKADSAKPADSSGGDKTEAKDSKPKDGGAGAPPAKTTASS